MNIATEEYFLFFLVKMKNLLLKKNYKIAKKMLTSLWDEVLFPLFDFLADETEDNAEYIVFLLYRYISLFISLVKQYPQLKIKDDLLYEYVLNYKYLDDLYSKNKHGLRLVLNVRKWMTLRDIKKRKEDLIIECFIYINYDMEDMNALFVETKGNIETLTYLLCFSLQFVPGLLSKYAVELIADIPFVELMMEIVDMFDQETVSRIEKKTWDRLEKSVYGKENIYICDETSTQRIPLTFMRTISGYYWGEKYKIIYCNTALDVKEDMEIQDISNSLYFGMSLFDNDTEKEDFVLKKELRDLPYVEEEIKKLGDLTGGDIYLNEELIKSRIDGKRKEILCFATHTVENKTDGTRALVVGKTEDEEYILLKSDDIAKLDWRGIKLVFFSACGTDEESGKCFERQSLTYAAKKAGALFSISTITEVDDKAAFFFAVCFHKNLLRYGKIAKAFFETQKIMSVITKKEILEDSDYLDTLEEYLEGCDEEDMPFANVFYWGSYILQMN